MELRLDAQLCNESSNIRDGPAGARQWPVPWRYGWSSIRQELQLFVENSADFFRQLSVRRHFKWLLSWFSRTAHTNIWLSGCPLGVLTLRLFTVLISNDADRCIQMRDARMGLELLHLPLAAVTASGWPCFRILAHLAEESRRISFPLDNACDDLDSEAARSFREQLLRPALQQQRLVPMDAAWKYLQEPPPRCAIGWAATYFALAAHEAPGAPGAERRNELLQRGQETLLEWPSLQRSLYALLTTRWPLWHSLERLRNASGVQTVYVKQLEGQSVDLDVVFCGNGVEGLQQTLRGWCERKGWRLHFLRADLAACPSFYQSISLPNSGHVLMLSPLLWSMEGVEAAVDALNFSLFDEADVLGFPTLDATLLWTFAVQRIRRSPWSVRYEAFPTGYEETLKDRCFRADATSMSRAFQSATWQRLVQRLRPSQGVGKVEEEMAWFVDLDLEILAARLRVYLCMGPPIPEDPYLSRVRLVPWLARKYRLEEAHFTDSNVQQLCLGPADAGASPCAQQEGRMALATALAAWKDVRVLLDGAALLTAGRLPLGEDAAMQSLEVCSHDEGFLCSALETESVVLPMEVMVETEPSRCTFRSARDTGAAGTQLPPLLRVQRGGPACEGVEVFNMRLHNGMLLPVWQRPSSGDVEELAAHVLSCMALRLRLEAKTWRVHAPSDQLQGSECLEFLKRSVASLTEPVVLLSPFLLQEKWSDKTTQVLKRALLQLRLGDASVLSFLTNSELFSWRVRRLRHQYWKLEFSAVDEITDQRSLSGASCALGLASMTRVFAATTLQSLLSQVESDPEKPWNWLLDLDLQIHHAKIKAMSCADGPMPEVDYLPQISLTRHVSHKHQVEMADFDGRREVSCIKGANWFEVARKGLVAPYCFRRDVMKAFRQLRQWWTSLDARNFLVPEEGTFLALFRNGDAGIMPWDSDFDVKLYTEQDITMEGFMNRTLEPAFQSMQIEAYAYDGCGQDSYVLLRQANITHHIGDAYVRGSQRRHPWRARLFGTEISLSPEHLEHIFFTRYRTPVAKLFGDGIALQCFLQGHNACMPDCRDPNLPCDFEDNFVHV